MFCKFRQFIDEFYIKSVTLLTVFAFLTISDFAYCCTATNTRQISRQEKRQKGSSHSEKGKVDEKNEQDGTPSTVKRRITAYTRGSADKSQPTSFSERDQ